MNDRDGRNYFDQERDRRGDPSFDIDRSKTKKERFKVDIANLEEEIPDHVPSSKPAAPERDTEKSAQKTAPRSKPPRQRGMGYFRSGAYIISVLIVSAVLAMFIITFGNDMLGLVKIDRDVQIEVDDNITVDQLADLLKEKKLIDNKFGFKLYIMLFKPDADFLGNTYDLNANMGYRDIVRKMTTKSSVRETIRVVIPEGYKVEQIAERLEQNRVCDKNKFLKEVQTGDFSQYEFIKEMKPSSDKLYRLEGYLFPDTYDFYVGESPESVIRRFLERFRKQIYTDEVLHAASKQNYTMEELMTVASIVQTESGKSQLMDRVAGVFVNRLNNAAKYPTLDSNATLNYVLPEPKAWFSEEDFNNPSPYNTYRNKGLPPGPICNPGREAVIAVLEPVKNGEFFFVSDQNGVYYFSTTYARHQEQIRSIQNTGKGISGTGVA